MMGQSLRFGAPGVDDIGKLPYGRNSKYFVARKNRKAREFKKWKNNLRLTGNGNFGV